MLTRIGAIGSVGRNGNRFVPGDSGSGPDPVDLGPADTMVVLNRRIPSKPIGWYNEANRAPIEAYFIAKNLEWAGVSETASQASLDENWASLAGLGPELDPDIRAAVEGTFSNTPTFWPYSSEDIAAGVAFGDVATHEQFVMAYYLFVIMSNTDAINDNRPKASTDWRLKIRSSQGGASEIIVRTIEFLDAGGNAISTAGAVAFGSTPISGTRDAAKAFDEDASATSYFSNAVASTGAPVLLGLTFPAPVAVKAIRMRADGTASYAPGNFDIEYLKDGVWTYGQTIAENTWTDYGWKTFNLTL